MRPPFLTLVPSVAPRPPLQEEFASAVERLIKQSVPDEQELATLPDWLKI